ELLVAGELRTGRRRPLDALKVRIDHAPHEPGFAPLEPHGYVAEAAARRESGRRQRGRQRGHIRVHETAEYAPLAIRARVATERLLRGQLDTAPERRRRIRRDVDLQQGLTPPQTEGHIG